MNLSRAIAEMISSPSRINRVVHHLAAFQSSSLYSTGTKRTSTKRIPKSLEKTKEEDQDQDHSPLSSTSPPLPPLPPPLDSSQHLGGFDNQGEISVKDIMSKEIERKRPSEIPWQNKVANSVNLIGSVATAVQFQVAQDGKVWAGTVLTQENPPKNLLWIPLIFEGDLAHIAAFHLKEKDVVHVTGQLSGDPPQLTMEHGQSPLQVMVRSISFVHQSDSIKESNTYEKGEKASSFSERHEWGDYVSNKSNPACPDFKHKDNGHLLGSDESPTKPKKAIGQTSVRLVKDRESESSWRDLLDNPNHWSDNRKMKLNGKVNPKFPDFKQKDGSKALWLDSAPVWVLAKVKEMDLAGSVASKMKDDIIHKMIPRKDSKSEESWKSLVENPNKWWDNRIDKRYEKSPDFKHKETGEGLWLNTAPAWVQSKLPPLKSGYTF